jgi:hypothetical protein
MPDCQFEILQYCHVAEDAPSFGHVSDAVGDNLISGSDFQIFSSRMWISPWQGIRPDIERRMDDLPCPVGSDQYGDFSKRNIQK